MEPEAGPLGTSSVAHHLPWGKAPGCETQPSRERTWADTVTRDTEAHRAACVCVRGAKRPACCHRSHRGLHVTHTYQGLPGPACVRAGGLTGRVCFVCSCAQLWVHTCCVCGPRVCPCAQVRGVACGCERTSAWVCTPVRVGVACGSPLLCVPLNTAISLCVHECGDMCPRLPTHGSVCACAPMGTCAHAWADG